MFTSFARRLLQGGVSLPWRTSFGATAVAGSALLFHQHASPALLEGDQYLGLTSLTRANLPSLIKEREGPVLVDAYDPDCGACATFKPVMIQVAHAFAEESKWRIALFDAENEYHPDFFTNEELYSLPLIKFYPYCSDLGKDQCVKSEKSARDEDQSPPSNPCSPLYYHGHYNSKSIIDFLYQSSNHGFNRDRVLARAAELNQLTDERLVVAANVRAQKDPTYHVYKNAPCGDEMMEFVHKKMMISRLLNTPPSMDEQQAIYDKFQTCMKLKEKELESYWKMLSEVAKTNLEKYEDRTKSKPNVSEADIQQQIKNDVKSQ